MTPEEHSSVRELYERARALTGSARDGLLERECPEQSPIRQEVERLLKAQDKIPVWLDQPALGEAPRFMGRILPGMEGRQIGDYTLLREIGRGGMGFVYLAERSDGAFQKQVALKVMIPSANSGTMLARFHHEREILASLDHPNIARLIDGGATAEGWPYFVMEYVEGQPIHRWCDERKLDISQRLELFKGVMAAVGYAHERLVVHRDLKPGNILVTGEGVVKLLDFGIAKLIAANTLKTLETVTLAGMMTPEYASPEQMNGAPITTRSDIYSLGVVLYEMLTGHRPYRLLSAAVHEMARVIAEMEPPAPSAMVFTTEAGRDGLKITPDRVSEVREGDPNRLRKRLAGDLDAILLTALRKEPERRYTSVEALAGDLDRHLEHRPVAARPATVWYRLLRFCRRNPGAMVAIALMVVPMATGIIAVVALLRRDLRSAGTAGVDGGPFLLVAGGIGMVGLGVGLYIARPGWRQFLGAACGATVWAAAAFGKMWLALTMGWMLGGLPNSQKPLMLFGGPFVYSPFPWIVEGLLMTAAMFLLSWIRVRFGWLWLLVFLGASSTYTILREHFMFTYIIPVIQYAPGSLPIVVEIIIFFTGGLAGLLLMRAIVQPSPPKILS